MQLLREQCQHRYKENINLKVYSMFEYVIHCLIRKYHIILTVDDRSDMRKISHKPSTTKLSA